MCRFIYHNYENVRVEVASMSDCISDALYSEVKDYILLKLSEVKFKCSALANLIGLEEMNVCIEDHNEISLRLKRYDIVIFPVYHIVRCKFTVYKAVQTS